MEVAIAATASPVGRFRTLEINMTPSIEETTLFDQRPRSPTQPRPWLLPAILLLGFLPMLVVFPAPLADWASHLARVAVTDRVLHGDPFWSERYHFQGFLIPNAVLDVVVLGFLRLGLPLDAAGVCCLALCYGSFVTGFVRLSRIGSVPTIPAASLAIMLFYTGNVMYGLVNYMIGLGLAMLAAAYCLRPRSSLRQRCLIAALAVPVIAFCHIVAAGIFVAIYGATMLFRPLPATFPFNQQSAWRRRAWLLLPAVIGGVICAVAFLLSPAGTDKMTIAWVGQPSVSGLLYGKIKEAAEGLSSGFELADGLFAVIVAVMLLGLWRNRVNVQSWTLKVVGVVTLLPLLAPFSIGAGLLFDARMAIAALGVAMAMLPWAAGLRADLQTSVTALCATRIAFLALLWLSYRPVYHDIDRAFAALPVGSTLLSAYTDVPDFYADRAPPLHEIAALAVRHGVFVPNMWAEASQQPLVINPDWRPQWLWSHSANARTPENLASVRARAKRYCDIDPNTHLFLLHVTQAEPFSIESPCGQR